MIYVADMMACLKSNRWPYAEACHLFCDVGELAKLYAFARDLCGEAHSGPNDSRAEPSRI
jgi:hypothetical protein